MSIRHLPPSGERRRSRVGALALVGLLLLGACSSGARPGGRLTTYRDQWRTPRESLAPRDNEIENGALVFARLPTDFEPVRMGDAEFQAALMTLVLDMPLRVASSVPPQLRADDKRSIALALAVGPALEGVGAEVRAMLDPTRVLATVSIAITAYMALVLAPEPVSKGAAAAFTVLLWGYLGWEFFDLLRAYARLYEDAPRASTFAELREVGERFGRVIGPNSVRILVMVGTAAVGETAALMSKAPKLPGFGQASRNVEVNAGLRMVDAATGAERVIVSVPEGTIRVVLPATAVAMSARNSGGKSSAGGSGTPKGGRLFPNGHRAFKSFDPALFTRRAGG